MYRRTGEDGGDVLGYRLSGRLTEAEVKEMQREMDAAIEEHGKVRVLCDMGDFSGAVGCGSRGCSGCWSTVVWIRRP